MNFRMTILAVLLLSLSVSSYGEVNKTQIDKAVAAAEKVAIGCGYDIKDMGMMLNVNDLPWFMRGVNDKDPESDPKYKLLKLLEGKEYVSVYYKPHGKHSGDGDICIIIDAKDWETILSVYESETP